MLRLMVTVALCGYAAAMVCPPCTMIKQQEPLNCKGGMIQGGGFCGCSDACAKVEGEICQAAPATFGFMTHGKCDVGFECVSSPMHHLLGTGTCRTTAEENRSARFVDGTQTQCQLTKAQMSISFVIWKGQWMPKCDAIGNYMPEQCDNEGKCFCVSAVEGTLLTSRVHGSYSGCEAVVAMHIAMTTVEPISN